MRILHMNESSELDLKIKAKNFVVYIERSLQKGGLGPLITDSPEHAHFRARDFRNTGLGFFPNYPQKNGFYTKFKVKPIINPYPFPLCRPPPWRCSRRHNFHGRRHRPFSRWMVASTVWLCPAGGPGCAGIWTRCVPIGTSRYSGEKFGETPPLETPFMGQIWPKPFKLYDESAEKGNCSWA